MLGAEQQLYLTYNLDQVLDFDKKNGSRIAGVTKKRVWVDGLTKRAKQ